MMTCGSRVWRVAAVVGALWLAAAACHPQPPPGYGPIRVLAAFNLSGSDAELDVAAFNGARLAAQAINRNGGVRGRNLELVAVDTASNPRIAVQAVGRALDTESDIVAGIGYCDSTFADAVGALFQRAGIPFVSPGATDPRVPGRVGNEMFFAAFGDDAQARVMAQYALEELGLRRIAVWMDDRQDYTTTVASYFVEAVEKLGGHSELHTEAPAVSDFSRFIAQVKKTKPPFDAIYGATMPAQAAPFISQVREAGLDVPLLSGDGWDEAPVTELSRKSGISDVYFTTHRFLGVDSTSMQSFVEAYQSAHGNPPSNAFAALGYDAVGLLADAMKRAGTTSPEAITQALASTTDYEGIVGPIHYSPGSRVPTKPVEVVRVDKGQKTAVWTATPSQ
ncbi:MAG: ABC transporter substrate-binding protein [Myxococcota bacterium]